MGQTFEPLRTLTLSRYTVRKSGSTHIVHAATSVGSCTQNTSLVYAATDMDAKSTTAAHVLHVASVFIHFFLYNVGLAVVQFVM